MAEPEVEKEFYPGGSIYSETPYIDGKRNGVAKIYWENGNLKFEMPYKNDRQEAYKK